MGFSVVRIIYTETFVIFVAFSLKYELETNERTVNIFAVIGINVKIVDREFRLTETGNQKV